MADKPQIDFGTDDADDAGFEEGYLEEHTERDRVKFNTRLRADLYEKLRAAAFWTDQSITEHVEEAVLNHIRDLEEEREEPFEVLDPHRVDDS
jgi:uncharacterized protein (DUF1778 family)